MSGDGGAMDASTNVPTGASTATPCPQCGHDLVGGASFVQSCAACEWNVDPGHRPDPPAAGWRARRARGQVDRAAERGRVLFAEVSAEGEVGRPSDGVMWMAMGFGALVLLADLVVIGLGVWGTVVTWFEPLTVFAFVLALIGVAAMGRPGKRPAGVRLARADAPQLFGLCDDIGRPIGTSAPDEIVVCGGFNAGVTRVGLRGRRVVTIGVHLWTLLDSQERVAVLGHELAHDVNGDPSRGLVVGLAVSSLYRWSLLFRPPTPTTTRRVRGGSAGAIARLSQLVAALLMLPISSLLLFAGGRLRRLRVRGGNRAEYVADQLSAQVAGSTAMVQALQVLLLVPSCARALENRRARNEQGDTLAFIRRHVDELPPSEKERLTRVAARESSGIDDTHPPLVSRLALIANRREIPPALVLSAHRNSVIDAELVPAIDEVLGRKKTTK